MGMNDLREYETTAELIERFLSLIEEMLRNRKNRQSFRDISEDKQNDIIYNAMKNGEVTVTDMIDVEDSQLFSMLMKEKNVPYSMVEVTTEDGKRKNVFITRAQDKQSMDAVRQAYMYEMRICSNELRPSDFVKSNENKDVCVKKGLSASEIELFRRYISEEAANYSVSNNNGEYSIYYTTRDRDAVDRALKKTCYDLSGSAGRKYGYYLDQAIQSRNEFDKRLTPKEGEVLYVVDSKNPSRFISVTNKGYVIHSLVEEEAKTLKGNKIKNVVDKNPKVVSSLNRDQLIKDVEKMSRPVILTAEQMTIVKGISPTGQAILPPKSEFRVAYSTLASELPKRSDYYDPHIRAAEYKAPDKIYSFINLPDDVTSKLYECIKAHGLQDTIISGHDVAFTEKDSALIRPIIDHELYDGKTTLQKLEAKIFYEGRGFVNLSSPPEAKQYLVNAEKGSVEFLVEINPEGFVAYQKGKEVIRCSRESKDYSLQLEELVKTMNNPVALSVEEMKCKNEAIKAHLNPENEAVRYIKDRDNVEKMDLCRDDGMVRSDRQREALSRFNNIKEEVHYVDHTLLEKIVDMDMSQRKSYTTTLENDVNISH